MFFKQFDEHGYFISSDSFNGAARDNYSWTQSHDDIDVRVKITKDHRKFAVRCPGGMKLKGIECKIS